MEKRLNQKDFDILFSGKRINNNDVDYKYIPPFDVNNDDDYIEALIHDSEQNFLESVIVDREDYRYIDIEGVPELKIDSGTILRKSGYDRGRYVVKYNFLRKVAGSYETILVDEEGDTYDPSLGYHVMPDGTIMDGESHENTTGKILQIKELKYFIQEISPSRNEIRIVPQKLKDKKYINSFINLQSKNNDYTFRDTIRLFDKPTDTNLAVSSTTAYISQNELLRPNMEGGILYINNAFIERVIPPKPSPSEGNLTEEVDTSDSSPPVVSARFVILEETTNYFEGGEKDFDFLYNHFSRNGTNFNITKQSGLPKPKNFGPPPEGNNATIGDVEGASADTNDGKDDVLRRVAKFTRPTGNLPTILTLASVSSRPQNVSFEYEWNIFGYDRNESGGDYVYDPISGRIGDQGNIVINGETAGSLTAKGTDKKQVTIQIFGGDVRLGVALKISRPAENLNSSIALPHAIFVR